MPSSSVIKYQYRKTLQQCMCGRLLSVIHPETVELNRTDNKCLFLFLLTMM